HHLYVTPSLLTGTYRHKQKYFLDFLDILRKGAKSDDDKNIFLHYSKELSSNQPSDKTTFLVQTNSEAEKINNKKLKELDTKKTNYIAKIYGDWETAYPNDYKLNFKIGAQVIFIKNDIDKQFVNGNTGVVVGLEKEKVIVELFPFRKKINVYYQVWEKIKYVYDKEEKKLKRETVGSFSQIPLKLGWAITINRSQGLTLNHISIDLSRRFFARGMLYVALSRAKRFQD
ncbi:uncharacterized protein METZ01_LOCUS515609, partial [marine metagenome]